MAKVLGLPITNKARSAYLEGKNLMLPSKNILLKHGTAFDQVNALHIEFKKRISFNLHNCKIINEF